jgi:hypothetical protein
MLLTLQVKHDVPPFVESTRDRYTVVTGHFYVVRLLNAHDRRNNAHRATDPTLDQVRRRNTNREGQGTEGTLQVHPQERRSHTPSSPHRLSHPSMNEQTHRQRQRLTLATNSFTARGRARLTFRHLTAPVRDTLVTHSPASHVPVPRSHPPRIPCATLDAHGTGAACVRQSAFLPPQTSPIPPSKIKSMVPPGLLQAHRTRSMLARNTHT